MDLAEEFENEEDDAGTIHEYKKMSVDDLHKISTNVKPAGSLGVDQDAKTYNQNIAESEKK